MATQVREVVLNDGRHCECITLKNESGAYVEILTLGGIIKSVYVPDAEGTLENVVLEYQDINSYIENPGYLNALIGRTAGRIHKGQVTLDGTTYSLNKNESTNTLHGGVVGIDKKVWKLVEVKESPLSVTMACSCEDGEEGYPGKVDIQVTYTFTEDNALKIFYEGETDKDTVLNLTNHAYFNLAGNGKTRIEDQLLRVQADFVCELDEESIPTGKLLAVAEEKVFDFNEMKPIGQDIEAPHHQLQLTRGYDHPWLIKGEGEVVELYDPISKRRMTVETNQKVVVIYAMNYENPSKFTNGLEDTRRYGICFETQNLPIGHGEVFKEGSILKKGEKYIQETVYKFSC